MNNDILDAISGPINATWQAIGSDVLELEEEMSNYTAVECIVDGDRLAMYGGDNGEANRIVRNLFIEHGHMPTMTFLCKNFRFA
jgi:hypothetical protein